VTHKQNSSDYGIYISDTNQQITYFHYLGYFYTEPLEDYQVTAMIQILNSYQFRYKSRPSLGKRINNKTIGLSGCSKEMCSKNANFGLPQKDTCPICLKVHVPGTSVYSYHDNHSKHWACNDCYHTYNEITQQSCPICRLPFSH